MRWTSTPDAYGRAAIALHWASAALILGLLAAGFIAANTTDPGTKAMILRLHAPLGITVLVLTAARLLWWALADRKPAPQPGPRWQMAVARYVHIGLLVATLGLAGSGIALFVFSGAGAILFGGAAQPLPDFWGYPPRYAHAAFARLAVILVALHAGAALYHHVIVKDGLLARMGIGR